MVQFQVKLSIFTDRKKNHEKDPHLLLSCSSRHWRRKSDSAVLGNPDVLGLHTTTSVLGLQTAYWPDALLET